MRKTPIIDGEDEPLGKWFNPDEAQGCWENGMEKLWLTKTGIWVLGLISASLNMVKV